MSSIGKLISLMECKPFRGRLGEEDRICLEWSNRLRTYTLDGRLAGCWSHIANEAGGKGRLAAIQAAKARALGMIKGTPDFIFTKHDKALWVEAKSVTGSLSPSQRNFRDWATSNSIRYAVVRSADDGDKLLKEEGFLL